VAIRAITRPIACRSIQQWQARAGLSDSPRTILTEFSRIHAADIVLPLAEASERGLRN